MDELLRKIVRILDNPDCSNAATASLEEFLGEVFLNLQKSSPSQLMQLSELLLLTIAEGDPKTAGIWQHLLPKCLEWILKYANEQIRVIDREFSGLQYRQRAISKLLEANWSTDIIIPMATMAKELPLQGSETQKFVTKMCQTLPKLRPDELPPLVHLLIRLCNTASLILIPIFTLEKYFSKHHYKALLQIRANDSAESTDLDSIQSLGEDEEIDEKAFFEAEETVLFHLEKAAGRLVTENELATVLKALTATPNFVLSPFLISSFLAFCQINSQRDVTGMSSSVLLPVIRSAIWFNIREQRMTNESLWCNRQMKDYPKVSTDEVFKILIANSAKGLHAVTVAMVGLGFCLLRAKKDQKELHLLADNFFKTFFAKRSIYSKELVRIMVNFMLANQSAEQYVASLQSLALNHTRVLKDHGSASFKELITDFLLMDGETAMHQMCIIFPLIKISPELREEFQKMLDVALYEQDLKTRKMAIMGTCLILKQTKSANSTIGSQMNFTNTQTNLFGATMITQMTMTQNHQPNRFEIFVLGLFGKLYKVLYENVETKELLYDCLFRAIESNARLIPYVTDFLNRHFMSFFNHRSVNLDLKLAEIAEQELLDRVVVHDHFGKLSFLLVRCVILAEQAAADTEQRSFANLRETFGRALEHVSGSSLDKLGVISPINTALSVVGSQYLNFLESLMAFCVWTAANDNVHAQKLDVVFRHFRDNEAKFMALVDPPKTAGGKKKREEVPKDLRRPDNVWDMPTLVRFLRIFYELGFQGIPAAQADRLRANEELEAFVLRRCVSKLQAIREMPSYFQMQTSKRCHGQVAEIARLLFDRMKAATGEGVKDILLVLETLKETLRTSDVLYKTMTKDFFRVVTNEEQDLSEAAYSMIAAIFDHIGRLSDVVEQSFDSGTNESRALFELLSAVEILEQHIPASHPRAHDTYKLLFAFCERNEVNDKQLAFVHRLLFTFHERAAKGDFYRQVACQLVKEYETQDDTEIEPDTVLKSITLVTRDTCALYLIAQIKSHLESVDFFVRKANGFLAKMRVPLGAHGNQDFERNLGFMQQLENVCVWRLMDVCHVLIPLSNAKLTGRVLEAQLKILVQLHIAMENLVKHLIARHAALNVAYKDGALRRLLDALRPLSRQIANLLLYTDKLSHAQVLELKTTAQQRNAQAKVLKDTRLLPRLVVRMEKFNVLVAHFGSKIKEKLAELLYTGKYRDLHLHTKKLEQSLMDVRSQAVSEDLEELDEDDSSNATPAESENEDEGENSDSITPAAATAGSSSSGASQIRRNLKKVNEKTAGRGKKGVRQGRITKKTPVKINRDVLNSKSDTAGTSHERMETD